MNRLSERSLLLLLAAVQFTHIVDFMILMPLGPQLMRELHIGPGGFSALVAAYTISSGVIGLLGAPFIDRFDRRRLLLFAYAGFIGGTLACASYLVQLWLNDGRGDQSGTSAFTGGTTLQTQ